MNVGCPSTAWCTDCLVKQISQVVAAAAPALSCVNRLIQDMPIEHPRTALVYKKINQAKDQAELKSRKDAVFLAQTAVVTCRLPEL